MWGVPMFFFFGRGEPIGWRRHATKGCFLSFWRGWALISHQVPKQFPSNSSCSHRYPIQILLFSPSSQKITIKFLLFPLSFNQIHFIPSSSQKVPIKFLLFSSPWRWAQVSTKVNGETRARLGQSAKRSATIHGQAGRGATVAARRLQGVAEQKLGIFCQPGFVQDRGQICFSRHAASSMCDEKEIDAHLLAKFRQKAQLKIRERSDFEGFQSPEVRGGKKKKKQKRGKIARLVIWFHCVAKNTEAW